MKFASAILLFRASTLAFPYLAKRENTHGGASPNDTSLLGSIIAGIEDEDTATGGEGPALADILAPILGPLTPKRDLIGGLLQPLTGILAGLDLPTPQSQGLAKIPDEAHPYIAPGPADVRGLCPTLNTLANRKYS
jgi:hypothetical protein